MGIYGDNLLAQGLGQVTMQQRHNHDNGVKI